MFRKSLINIIQYKNIEDVIEVVYVSNKQQIILYFESTKQYKSRLSKKDIVDYILTYSPNYSTYVSNCQAIDLQHCPKDMFSLINYWSPKNE